MACPGATPQALFNAANDESYLGLTAAQTGGIVKVFDADRPDDGPLCSGAFIARDWVVTAQHCLVIPSMAVGIGGSAGTASAALPVLRSVAHPSRDIALLQVDGAASSAMDAAVSPASALRIASPDAIALSVGDVVELAGFGLSETGDTRRRAFLAESIVEIDEATIVVGGFGASGACEGDSGGPVLARDTAGGAVVLGVLSAGSASCLGEDQYVRLDPVRDWIVGIAGDDAPADRGCGTITEQGRCLYGSSIWCNGTELAAERCGDGKQCGWDATRGGFRCVRASDDPCLGVDSVGACRENEALACNAGALVRESCGPCEACRVDGRTGRAHCAAAP